MKYTPRKITESANRNIVIRNGNLEMVDGSDLQEYLLEFQRTIGLENGSFVNVIDTNYFEQLRNDSVFLRAMGA